MSPARSPARWSRAASRLRSSSRFPLNSNKLSTRSVRSAGALLCLLFAITAFFVAVSACSGGSSSSPQPTSPIPTQTATTTTATATTPTPGADGAVPDASTGPTPADAGDRDASDAAEASGPVLAPEVGFFDVPAQPTAARYEARLFYVFQPADSDAAHKPIFVLSNGGPGSATTAGLVAYGTGRYSLSANAEAGAPPALNPSSWTSFANLLYIDSRQAGFSYGLGAATTPGCAFSEVEDASDFVRALLEFFDAHPTLRASPVVVGGESYAGTRANWMLDLLLRYGTEASKGGPDLEAKIQAHFDVVFPGLAGTVIDQAMASQQFGAQVLIEPLVLGQQQYTQQNKLLATNPYVGPNRDGGFNAGDTYDTQEPNGWFDATLAHAMTALSTVGPAAQLSGPISGPFRCSSRLRARDRSTGTRSSMR